MKSYSLYITRKSKKNTKLNLKQKDFSLKDVRCNKLTNKATISRINFLWIILLYNEKIKILKSWQYQLSRLLSIIGFTGFDGGVRNGIQYNSCEYLHQTIIIIKCFK